MDKEKDDMLESISEAKELLEKAEEKLATEGNEKKALEHLEKAINEVFNPEKAIIHFSIDDKQKEQETYGIGNQETIGHTMKCRKKVEDVEVKL